MNGTSCHSEDGQTWSAGSQVCQSSSALSRHTRRVYLSWNPRTAVLKCDSRQTIQVAAAFIAPGRTWMLGYHQLHMPGPNEGISPWGVATRPIPAHRKRCPRRYFREVRPPEDPTVWRRQWEGCRSTPTLPCSVKVDQEDQSSARWPQERKSCRKTGLAYTFELSLRNLETDTLRIGQMSLPRDEVHN